MDRFESYKLRAIEKYDEYFGLWTALLIYLIFLVFRIKAISALLLSISCVSGFVIYLSPVVSYIHDDRAKAIFIGTICIICILPVLGFDMIGAIVVLALAGLAYGIASVDISLTGPHTPLEQLLQQHKLVSFRQIYPDQREGEDQQYHDNRHISISQYVKESRENEGKKSPLSLIRPPSDEPSSPRRVGFSNTHDNAAISTPMSSSTAIPTSSMKQSMGFLSRPNDDAGSAVKNDLSISKYLIESLPLPSSISPLASGVDYSTPEKMNARSCIPPAEAAKLVERVTALCDNNERIAMVEAERDPYLFGSDVLLQLMNITESMRTKLAFVSLLGPRLVDPRARSEDIIGCFNYAEEREKVSEILKTRTHNLNSAIFSRGPSLHAGSFSNRSGRGSGRGAGSLSRGSSLSSTGKGGNISSPSTIKVGAASPRIIGSSRSPRLALDKRPGSKISSPRSPRSSPPPSAPPSTKNAVSSPSNLFQENKSIVTASSDINNNEIIIEPLVPILSPAPTNLPAHRKPPLPSIPALNLDPSAASASASSTYPLKRSLSVDAKTFRHLVQREVTRRLKEIGATAVNKPTTPENKTKGWSSPYSQPAESPLARTSSIVTSPSTLLTYKVTPLKRATTLPNDELVSDRLRLLRPDECDIGDNDDDYEDVDVDDLIDEDEKDDSSSNNQQYDSPVTRTLSEVVKKLEHPSPSGFMKIDDLIDASDMVRKGSSTSDDTNSQESTPRDPVPVQVILPQRISVMVPPRMQETVIMQSAEKVRYDARYHGNHDDDDDDKDLEIEPMLYDIAQQSSDRSTIVELTLQLHDEDGNHILPSLEQDMMIEAHNQLESSNTTSASTTSSEAEVQDVVVQQPIIVNTPVTNVLPSSTSRDISPYEDKQPVQSPNLREEYAKEKEKRASQRHTPSAATRAASVNPRAVSTGSKITSTSTSTPGSNPRVINRSLSPATRFTAPSSSTRDKKSPSNIPTSTSSATRDKSPIMGTSSSATRDKSPNSNQTSTAASGGASTRLQAVKNKLRTNPDRYISPGRRVNNLSPRDTNKKAVSWNDAYIKHQLEDINNNDDDDDMMMTLSTTTGRLKSVRQVSQGLNDLLRRSYSMRNDDPNDMSSNMTSSASYNMDLKAILAMPPADPIGYDPIKKVSLYSYIEVVRRNYSKVYDGISNKELEKYIEDDDFMKVFGMSKGQYYELAKWRQITIKKRLYLF